MKLLKDSFDLIKGSILEYGIKVLLCVVLLLVGLKVIKVVVKRIHRLMEKRNVEPTIVQFTSSFLKITLKILLVITILITIGVEVTSFVAIIGALSFAVGMALQGSLANFAAGVIILILRPFRVGDYVELNGLTGTVSKIEVFATDLKTPDNKTILIPNGNIIGSNIINYSLEAKRRVDFKFGVDYKSDVKTVKDILYKTAKAHALVLEDPDVFVGLIEFGESSINFVLRAWVNTPDYWTVYFELMEEVKEAFNKENISIPFPHVHIVKD